MRYRLLCEDNQIQSEILLEKDLEFPRIDDRLDGLNYRYLYMTWNEGDHQGLIKFDTKTRQFQTWHQPGCQALEPIFVPRACANNEDDGVILTVVYDEEKNRSFLLALDGQSFEEIARADLPWRIPGSFHGQFFSESYFMPSIAL